MSPQSTSRWLPSAHKPRRPASMGPIEAAGITGGLDPQTSGEVAHMTASVVVGRGRAQATPEVIDRLITLVDREGIDVVAGMWADSAANTLPGVLWRMYSLREQVRVAPDLITAHYRAGLAAAEVQHAVVGVIEPPEPTDILRLLDTVLSGLFTGDFAVALERAAAFSRVLSTGAAYESERLDAVRLTGPAPNRRDTAVRDADRSARRLVAAALHHSEVAKELTFAAQLWRQNRLD